MSGFLLDTNVISELVKPRPEAGVTTWIEATDETLLHLSVLTLGEIRRGVVALPQARRRATLEAWLRGSARAERTKVRSSAGLPHVCFSAF
jgi:predicted nucleic acid-binding protein